MRSSDAESLLDRIIETADLIAAICEAPRGLKHPRHQAYLGPARAKIKAILAGYFRRQGRAILAEVQPHIKPVVGQFSEASDTGKRVASTLMPTSLRPLTFSATPEESSAYADIIAGLIESAAAELATDLETEVGLPASASSAFLRDNSLTKLTGNLADATREQLRTAIADAWDEGGTYEQLTAAITDTVEGMTESRADMIAQTEANTAYSYGRRQIADEAGASEKSWSADGTDACEEICQPNIDAGWIAIDDDFPSGDDDTPGHPRCDCGVDYRI